MKFSPSSINNHLGRNGSLRSDMAPTFDKITHEITGGQVKKWPNKGLLYSSILSVKYVVLNRIGA